MRRLSPLLFLVAVGCASKPPGPATLASLHATLDAEVQLRPAAITGGANGWDVAKQAIESYDKSGIRHEKADKSTLSTITPAESAKILADLQPVSEALDLAVQAGATASWEMPHEREWIREFPEAMKLKLLLKALVSRGRARLAGGNVDQGVADLLGARRFATGLMNAHGGVVEGLVGMACLAIADRAIERSARHSSTGDQAVKYLLAGIPASPKIDEAFQNALRGELNFVLVPELASVPDPVRDVSSETVITNVDPAELDKMLGGLPNSFDRRDTIECLSKGFAIILGNISAPWADQVNEGEYVRTMQEGWPHSFLLPGRPQYSAADIAQTQAKLKEQVNPKGRLLVANLIPTFALIVPGSFKWRTEQEAMRTILAVRLWRDSHAGVLPDSLNDLVKAGFLNVVPRDFFGAGALQYDKARARIWSVSVDGHNDNGYAAAYGARDRTTDRVWSLSGS